MIHVAGEMIEGVQRCERCNVILTDYRGAMVPVDQEPLGLGWQVGAHVQIFGANPTHLAVTEEEADCRVTH